ncbi:ROK family protein [Companilactobacillus huachuanensis]|uniref:ROK family protein n=1 Tax=Companilactobacillus huachuanensis TaxID=2559914 RepID=A0ABW1RQG4_9LACO|nr:ROK family protein [Companilactobacillus huachuanensis]
MTKVVIGIDIGGTTAKFGVVSENGQLINKWSIPTKVEDHVQDTMRKIISSIKEHIDDLDLIGIGVDVPGSVRPETKEVYDANNLGWESDVDIRPFWGEEFNVPIIVENDANAAALGEQWQGSGTKPNLLYVTLGTGVGSGLILDDKLIRGASGAIGEIGHVVVEPDGYLCTCVNYGCLETVSSATGIVHLYRDIAKDKADMSLTSEDIFNNAENDSVFELIAVEKACDYLGIAFANATNLLNLDEIIIGGGVSNAGEFLREKVEKAVSKHIFKSDVGVTKIKLASLGNDAGILGVCYLALSEIIINYSPNIARKFK